MCISSLDYKDCSKVAETSVVFVYHLECAILNPAKVHSSPFFVVDLRSYSLLSFILNILSYSPCLLFITIKTFVSASDLCPIFTLWRKSSDQPIN